MAVDPILGVLGFWGLLSAAIGFATTIDHRKKAREKIAKKESVEKNHEVDQFIENVMAGWGFTPRSSVEADKLKQLANVEETNKRLAKEMLRRREDALREFHAYQECPKCDSIGFHRIANVYFSARRRQRFPVRICNECKHQWRQQ